MYESNIERVYSLTKEEHEQKDNVKLISLSNKILRFPLPKYSLVYEVFFDKIHHTHLLSSNDFRILNKNKNYWRNIY